MLEIALKQEFPLHDDGFVLFDSGFNSYWVNQRGEDIKIMTSMPEDEARKYGEWLQENVPRGLMEYKDRYFSFGQWVA